MQNGKLLGSSNNDASGVSAISQFTVTKKDLDQVCKATKTAMQDLVVSGRSTHEEPSSTTSPHKKKLAASNNDNLVGEEKKRDSHR